MMMMIICLSHYLMVLYQMQILYGAEEIVTMLCMVGEKKWDMLMAYCKVQPGIYPN
jgi:hypothetical protein